MSTSQEQLPFSSLDPARPLRALVTARSVYEVPNDDLAGELLIPAMQVSTSIRVMVGFFNSRSFCQLAPGLAEAIDRDIKPLRLLVSPALSEEDRAAIQQALTEPEEIAIAAFKELLQEAGGSESAIAAHTANCLTYLLATGRLLLRLVLMNAGLFHPKVWLFESEGDFLAVHGSNNLTEAGLLYNGEIVSVDRSWKDGAAATARVEALSGMFESYWSNNHPHSLTIGPSVGLLIGDRASLQRPSPEDFWRAWEEDRRRGLAPPLPRKALEVVGELPASSPQALSIPEAVVWESGPFGHQGSAVRAWESNGRKGILAIATGGGKTTSALIAATRLQNESSRPLLVLILVPSNPLLDQWEREVRLFGVPPVALGHIAARERIARLHGVAGFLSHGVSRTEVLISSNKLFVGNEPLREFFRSLSPGFDILLIADEVHNLGAPGFLVNPPSDITFRLGLSATPIRQYDAQGTAELLEFFGDIVFEFGLGEAIKAGCLTPYTYHLHEIHLEREELDVWDELTEKLRRRSFSREDDGQDGNLDPAVRRLLERRRAVLENAAAKLVKLERILARTPPTAVQKTLIYTSAKRDPLGRGRQITLVNRLLNELGVLSHQLTYSETGGREAARLLDAFAKGEYQALTCMKVLDEGLDVPATTTAYLLASSTVLREWVQRRGRVLRKVPGKFVAAIHDFFVVPPDPNSPSGRLIIASERRRADEFCRLAENSWDNDGPRSILERHS